MKKRIQISTNIGFSFIILFLLLMTISISYSNWQEAITVKTNISTTEWDEIHSEMIIAYEDMLNIENDYDYNDFIVKISTQWFYIADYLIQVNITFEPLARSIIQHAEFSITIPANTFSCDGTLTIISYDKNKKPINFIPSSFDSSRDINLPIFSDIYTILPANGDAEYCVNTINNTKKETGLMKTVSLNFSGLFCQDIPKNLHLNGIQIHGNNLFFDPYLFISEKNQIHKEDTCFIVIPASWSWPRELSNGRGVSIWNVYPYNTTRMQGIKEGNPPSFTQQWYLEIPTVYRWYPKEI
jgi:LruC domain-containing protein